MSARESYQLRTYTERRTLCSNSFILNTIFVQ
jgi:hypothetical protein